MQKWRRRIVRWLAVALGLWCFFCLVFPYGIMLGRRHQIVSAMKSAESVWIEEFLELHGSIITHKKLDKAQRDQLIRILPSILPRGLPVSLKLCFDPHHRIVARAADGTEFTLTICFGCDQAKHTGSALYDMPHSGSEVLRKFFRRQWCSRA